MSRAFAITNDNELATKDAIELANALWCTFGDEVTIFSKTEVQGIPLGNIKVVVIPADRDTRPKVKNFVLKSYKSAGFNGKLHLLEDNIELKADKAKVAQMVADVEHMMDIYGLHNWMGTVTDSCNYVFSKYNPRLNIVIDRDEFKKAGIQEAIFCSHSNVQWMAYSLPEADDNELFFNEQFTIDMFWIIEFLARRRNTHPGSLYFMNQYYTCKSEYGVYGFKQNQARRQDDPEDLKKRMQEEDKIFKCLGVNYTPDNNIDRVLETLYAKLQEAIAV